MVGVYELQNSMSILLLLCIDLLFIFRLETMVFHFIIEYLIRELLQLHVFMHLSMFHDRRNMYCTCAENVQWMKEIQIQLRLQ